MSPEAPGDAGATLLGFDFGLARIGVAVGSRLTGMAEPLLTVRQLADGPDWAAIDALIRDWQPEMAVIGLPATLAGEETPMSEAARGFAAQLASRYGVPTELVDEQLSSAAAKQAMGEQRRAGQRRRIRRQHIDPFAAKLILETWLNERGTREPAS